MQDAGNGVYNCEYHPLKPGKYTVSITWGGHPIPRRYFPLPAFAFSLQQHTFA